MITRKAGTGIWILVLILLAVSVWGYWQSKQDDGPQIVQAGQTVQVVASVKRSLVRFAMVVTDENNRPQKYLKLANGNPARPPSVKVLDSNKKEVYSFKLRRG